MFTLSTPFEDRRIELHSVFDEHFADVRGRLKKPVARSEGNRCVVRLVQDLSKVADRAADYFVDSPFGQSAKVVFIVVEFRPPPCNGGAVPTELIARKI